MPRRAEPFITGEIYHIFNRSVGKEHIFTFPGTLIKVLDIIEFYRYPQSIRLSKFHLLNETEKYNYLIQLKEIRPFVELYAYCFMPNHFHFLLKQLEDNGIEKFLTLCQNSFARYFNIKYERHGALFQSQFKGKLVQTDEQFMHISRYIHLNPVTAYIFEIDDLQTSLYTSFSSYIGTNNQEIIDHEYLLSMFGSIESYKEFVFNRSDYQRKLAELKNLILE